jgi:alpha-methylacyl-CoA racemase
MIDGAVLLSQQFWTMKAQGNWGDTPGTNFLNGGAPFYDVYECADGQYLAVGAFEPEFYGEFVRGLGLDPENYPQDDRESYLAYAADWARIIAGRSQSEWVNVYAGTDSCVSPVHTLTEAPTDPHIRARELLVEVDGHIQAAPAPRFSRTPPRRPAAPPIEREILTDVLDEWRRSERASLDC